jgi:uncharacterized protein (DUF58 family)
MLVVLQIFDPSYIWQALIVGLGGMWLVGWLWARSLKRNLRLTREMRFAWAQVGDKLEEQFALKNDGLVPATWVEILDHSTLPGYSARRVTGVDPRSLTAWHTFAVCTRRGVYQLGGTTLRSGDPFGIYTIEIHQPESTVLVIMPPIIPLPSIEVTPDGWIGDGRPRANAFEQTVSAASVREYIPGDTMRLIHWPTSARRGATFVRMLEGAPAGDWWILLDFDPNVQAGEDWDTTAELGVILTASLIDRGLRARRSVGLLASGKPPIWIHPQPGEHRRWELLRSLAVLEPDGPPLAQFLQRAGPMLARQTSLIVITPSTQSEWLSPLGHLCWRGITPTVLLMDASTFGAPQSADLLAAALGEMGIPRVVLSRELLHQPEARPGWRGQWKWRLTPTGKAIAEGLPGDLNWRRLG